jgi:ethanolamine transporter EutH
MEVVNQHSIYAIADALAMKVFHNRNTGMVTGEVSREVVLGDLPVRLTMKVKSSHVAKGCTMVIVSVLGNLGFLVAVNGVEISIHALNLAKMEQFNGWLEKHRPESLEVALAALDKGVSRSFYKGRDDVWALAA